jgi:hypothetical protein
MTPSGRHKDLVGPITVKRLRELAAVDENRPRQLPDPQTRRCRRLIEPPIHRAVEHELLLLDLLRDFPD